MSSIFTWVALWLVISSVLHLLTRSIGQHFAQKDQLLSAALLTFVSLVFWPLSTVQWTKLGNILGDLQYWSLAERCFGRALKLNPQWIEAHLGAGTCALLNIPQEKNWQNAHQHMLTAYCLRRGTPYNLKHNEPHQPITNSPHQPKELQRAWQSQLKWLQTQKVIPDSELSAFMSTGHTDRALYLEQPKCHQSPLQICNTDQVVQAYLQTGLSWYDHFLQPEALNQLLTFCQRSTFWHHHYPNGYLGAYLDDGFSCPLLYQIAEALKARFPELLSDLHLIYMWSFKCHQKGTGVALHHDSASVNVNFWLTPNHANQETESGGLCVYTKEPPMHWNLERYTLSNQQMQNFIKEHNVPKNCVPYKQNRVVLFNSRLLHETQNFHFEPGYQNQRINVTLLFGKSPLRYHAPKQLLNI